MPFFLAEIDTFYFRPTNTGFCNQAVGHNTLLKYIPEMMSEANIPGYFTLHSLRATCITRLYNAGIQEQTIMEVSGHSSLAVREWKRTHDVTRKTVSKILHCEQEESSLSSSSVNPQVKQEAETSVDHVAEITPKRISF